MLQETPCYKHCSQALFLICDQKHNEINPVRKVTCFKNVPLSAKWIVNYSHSFTINTTSQQPERGNHESTCHGTAWLPPFKMQCFLLPEKGTESATNSCYRITSMQCFSKLRPELTYIYIFVHIQVTQNCTLLSHVDIYNVDGEQQDVKQRKQKPGKHCVVMFCNKTNADRVRLYQFPQTLDAGQYIWLLPATVPL